MAEVCVSPTYTEESPTYGIFWNDTSSCIPDGVAELLVLQTEALTELLTESSQQLLLEED